MSEDSHKFTHDSIACFVEGSERVNRMKYEIEVVFRRVFELLAHKIEKPMTEYGRPLFTLPLKRNYFARFYRTEKGVQFKIFHREPAIMQTKNPRPLSWNSDLSVAQILTIHDALPDFLHIAVKTIPEIQQGIEMLIDEASDELLENELSK